jgi:hypothetical protein
MLPTEKREDFSFTAFPVPMWQDMKGWFLGIPTASV